MYQDAFEAVCNAAKAKTNLFKKTRWDILYLPWLLVCSLPLVLSSATQLRLLLRMHRIPCRNL